MKKCLRILLLVIPLAVSLACSVLSASPDATSTPLSTPTGIFRLSAGEFFCSTDNEEARQAYNTALTFHEQGRVEEAKHLYLRAIELDPGFCDAMDNLGLLLRSQGDLDGAIYWYKRSIEIYPENTVAHQNLGLAYRLHGKYEEALDEYLLLIQIDPANPEGYYGAGHTSLYLERPAEAISYLEQAEALYLQGGYPEGYVQDTRYLLGTAHFYEEDFTAARDYLEPLYPALQNDPWLNYMLGICYLSQPLHDLEKARAYLLHAQELGMELPSDVLEAIK